MARRSNHTVEPTLNVNLARLLRRQKLLVEAERRFSLSTGSIQIDCYLERDDDVIAIEAEVYPATSVRADAESRIGLNIDGRVITLAVALIYPERLRNISDDQLEDALADCGDLRFSVGELHDTGDGKAVNYRWSAETSGSVQDLADILWDHWTQSAGDKDELADLVAVLDQHITTAADILFNNKGSRQRVIRELELQYLGIDELAGIRAATLIFANAMVFHELLSRHLAEVPSPDPAGRVNRDGTASHWEIILETNWQPIFAPALRAILQCDSKTAKSVLDSLRPAVERLASSNLPARHDLIGRVFHRLLIGGKYLSPNYTTIPAAIILSALAVDGMDVDWSDTESITKLVVLDPACGTGTLLVAAAEEIRRHHIRARLDEGQDPSDTLSRDLLEDTLYGYDVVAAVIHLTAATLAMMETGKVIQGTHLYPMPLTINRPKRGNPIPLLGSLDFLTASTAEPTMLDLFSEGAQSVRPRLGAGGTQRDRRISHMPPIDLAILNPPFFKSQGITAPSNEGTTWKEFYGLMISEEDSALMRKELQRRLKNLPATMKAGGSAFIALMDERLESKGTLACVLPTAVWTGSSWSAMRSTWREKYWIDWVVVSHDERHRSKTESMPGRNYVSFSESTRIAETLIVARRKPTGAPVSKARIVILAHNPDHPIDATNLARQLLAKKYEDIPSLEEAPGSTCLIPAGGDREPWGELVTCDLDTGPMDEPIDIGKKIGLVTAFRSTELLQTAWNLSNGELYFPGRDSISVPICSVEDIATTTEWHHLIKGPKGPYDIVETGRSGRLALWHHDGDSITSLVAKSNARLIVKVGRKADADVSWRSAGRLQIALELRLTSQSAAAVWSSRRMLGIRSWNTLRLIEPNSNAERREKALALWLNSTLGLLLRITHGNRSYLGRVSLPIEVLKKLPILDVRELDDRSLDAADNLWHDVAELEFKPYAQVNDDENRQLIDRRLISEILNLGSDAADNLDELRAHLATEPMIYSKF